MTPSAHPGRPGSTGSWRAASRRPGPGFPPAPSRPRSSPSTRAAGPCRARRPGSRPRSRPRTWREGALAAADYLAEVTSALSTAGSSAHAWMLAPAGLAYTGSARNEAWAALTLLALDRKEAADPEYVGLPLDQPRRRQALAILYRSSRVVSRSVDLARYAVAAIYAGRENVP